MRPARRDAAARGAARPWGTLFLVAASGAVLLAQAAGLLDAPAAWVLAPDRVAFPALLTYAFFHADVLHWVVNMALLLAVAPRLERAVGATLLLLTFGLGAVVAGLVHVSVLALFAHEAAARPLLGSSGGVMATLAMYAVRFHGLRLTAAAPRRGGAGTGPARRVSLPLGWALAAWLLTEGFFGWRDIASGAGAVAHWAHVGGFLAGLALAIIAGLHRTGRREDAAAQTSLDQQVERLAAYIREHPDDIPSRAQHAQRLLQLGERERAGAAWRRTVEYCLQTGRRREAAEAWLALRAAGLEPAPELAVQAARALEETDYREEALAVYDHLAASHGPESEGAALRAAQLAERLGQPEEARQRFQAFLLLHPQSQFVAQARRSLDRLLSRV